ncbi:hypothetical protein [Tsukamurella tyrosinosolvens]|uniref:hypothetical protein n=1 Tax=Tsukamurella tyrosinosolvens TaxID=57704 RepID=UPI00159EE476|nr:hypothetical protein [Tsukamurella tyrosinosolvens]
MGIKEYLDQTEHTPTEKEIEDSKRYSWRSWPKHDHAPSKRLALVTYGVRHRVHLPA